MKVVFRRGGVVEAEHPFCAVLVRGGGEQEDQIGDIQGPMTWRSAAKPFQLEVSAALMPADWADRELAVGASSHTGQPVHLELVETVLSKGGVGVGNLFCGADWPSHSATRNAAIRGSEHPLPIWNNCSGKHAFMAGACHACGWEADYRGPGHPLQQQIRQRVEERAGQRVDSVVDGCGVPCFVLPIVAMARAWASLGRAVERGDGLLGRIGSAMAKFPVEAGGVHRIDSDCMALAKQRVIAKIGAEGLICVAVPGADSSVVVKVRSGNDLARAVALGAVMERWFPGVLPAEVWNHSAVIRNVVGREVGVREVVD